MLVFAACPWPLTVFFVLTPCEASAATFPAPENVALGGAPKISGCGEGAALHESPDVHGGGDTGAATHGTAVEHTCASYTS